jgi:hypothetical protein
MKVMWSSASIIAITVGGILIAGRGDAAEVTAARTPPASVTLGDEDFTVTVGLDGRPLANEFGPRFDMTAWVKQVRLGKRQFLRADYGLSDEFGLSGVGVLGYEAARPGQSFVKIGVGELTRDSAKAYQFSHFYPVKRWFSSQVTDLRSDRLSVIQAGGLGDWAYQYHKTYRLQAADHRLTIRYELRNMGRRPIRFEQYNHNWFRIDETPIDDQYSVQVAFPVKSPEKPWCALGGDRFDLLGCVRSPVYFSERLAAPERQNAVTVRHAGTRCQITVTGDFAPRMFALYGQQDALCPEILADKLVEPGKTAVWERSYRFSRKKA